MILELIATTYVAASLSYSDVTNAIGQASDGDTVLLPAGTGAWSTFVEVDKAITIIGAGQGVTTITNETTTAGVAARSTLYISHSSGLFSLSDLTIHGNSTATTLERHGMYVESGGGNTNSCTVIERVTFVNCDRGVYWKTDGTGLIDSCILTNCDAGVYALGYNTTSYTAWPDSVTNYWGTTNAIVVEGNTFGWSASGPYAGESSFALASGLGGRWVFRNNIGISPSTGYEIEWLDHHGDQEPGGVRAVIFSETYGNTATLAGGFRWFNHRGMSALIYSNDMTVANHERSIDLQEEGASCHTPSYGDGDDVITNTYVWANTHNSSPLSYGIESDDSGTDFGYHAADCCTNYFELGTHFFTNAPAGYVALEYPHPLSSASGGGGGSPAFPYGLTGRNGRLWIGKP